jgi:chitin disaccharide deacetylase
MKILKYVFIFIALHLFLVNFVSAQDETTGIESSKLIIRLDDIGVAHGVNVGAEKILQTGLPISISVIWVAPWINEAVKMLKKYPNASVGVHLCVNAEWENYKWGPVLGAGTVPSLVDSSGYFPQGSTWFYNEIFKLEELEKEFRAQIEKAKASGLQIDYLDNHMGGGMMTDEQRQLCERLAKEYNLGISGYFGEARTGGVEGYYRKSNLEEFVKSLTELEPGKTFLMVNHPGQDTPEMQAMTLRTKDGSQNLAKQRNQVVESITSDEFKKAIENNNIKMLNYRMLIDGMGLEKMKRPEKK